ncbi:MAG: hypothetical protein COV96_00830 [Candidatus Zambryskibacteria bacterium CG11_big_fil_rev_8_21_14_0_20_42_18]|uniref:Uncharacterized protein n=1 Tax=Candidatus Zambryskibacteria bacterium CG_4_9_14_3_um_filter_42_15 TaxID=1975112 RepID=A0A2M7WSM0_9BACT|nr:MAG: hypothetical protein COV96_00830 [Candidatus Zambryskibacteria bacterium CG11_big_fil_rev_8_21_14_0_20_42_18]PJA33002.1 MAG: hypothetical protein CO185_01060 [Candidatus Zambryskibacteria bacterium CG_4_9_14_3_um_filter_42_15]
MIFKNSKVIIGFFSLAFLILLAVIVFGISDIRSKNQETSILLNEARQVTEAGGLTQSIKTIQANSREEITALDELVFTNDKLVSLIESIEEKGKVLKLNTKIASVERKESATSDPDLIRMVVEAGGSWSATSAFLHALESLPYRVMIEESILSQAEDSWRLRIVFSIHSFD